jgi:dihydroorotate dehydrogenase (fumarate)
MKTDITTKFAGLTLKSPIIIGASGITGNTKHFKTFEENGAGAIVLKSIFEEEIIFEFNNFIKEAEEYGYDNEFLDYFDYKLKQDNISKYIDLIKAAKQEVNIPIIASVNCVSTHEWAYFTKKIEEAGADALELNIFILPSDLTKSCTDMEKTYFEIVEKVKQEINIPVIVKMSYYFSNLGKMIIDLSEKADGLVLFNRFYNPDIDIKEKKIVNAKIFSTPDEILTPLRWVGISYGRVKSSLAATTGIHDGEGLIKMILAGADAVEIVSTIYKNGPKVIKTMLSDLENYMAENGFNSIEAMKGYASKEKAKNPAMYERAQFMRYFSDFDEDII